ncbi:hypothetical protein ACS0TY_031058 [Phlomoides rotata]
MAWRLVTDQDSLVCRVLKVKYFPRTRFLDSSVGNNPSMTWRSIWSAQDLVRRGTRWKLGDGINVSVWFHPWLNDSEFFYIRTPVVVGFEDLVVNDLIIPGTRLWDVTLIRDVFIDEDVEHILKTPISHIGFVDTYIWHFERNGLYSAKSGYELADGLALNDVHDRNVGWECLWKLNVPPKALSQLSGEKREEFTMVVWRIWKERNSRVWISGGTDEPTAVHLARKFLHEW